MSFKEISEQDPPVPHDQKLVLEHESQFLKLTNRIKRILARIRNLEKANEEIKDEFTLIKDALGIREETNGKRKKQIQEAYKRISKVKQESEEDYKNLRELVEEQGKIQQKTNESLAELNGYLRGSKQIKTEEKEEKKDQINWTRQKILAFLNQFLGWIFAIALLILTIYFFKH